MQPFFTLVRRELGSYFVSLSGYVIIASVAFLLGLSFTQTLQALANHPLDAPLNEIFFNTTYFWLVLILAAPVITMRTFAQEKATGTYETLMTVPVGDLTVVLAKFTGALIFYLLVWLPLVACLFLVRHYATEAWAVDPAVLASTFLGIVLIGCVYLAMGCYASSLTSSHAVAAMVSLALGIGLYLVGFRALDETASLTLAQRVLIHVSMFQHLKDFSSGIVDSRWVVFYVSLTIFFLFLTLKSVESRRWK